jgi:hypothetical protein
MLKNAFYLLKEVSFNRKITSGTQMIQQYRDNNLVSLYFNQWKQEYICNAFQEKHIKIRYFILMLREFRYRLQLDRYRDLMLQKRYFKTLVNTAKAQKFNRMITLRKTFTGLKQEIYCSQYHSRSILIKYFEIMKHEFIIRKKAKKFTLRLYFEKLKKYHVTFQDKALQMQSKYYFECVTESLTYSIEAKQFYTKLVWSKYLFQWRSKLDHNKRLQQLHDHFIALKINKYRKQHEIEAAAEVSIH